MLECDEDRGETLRLLFVSDWRIQPLEWLHEFLDRAVPVDVLVYGGDDVARFGFTMLNKYTLERLLALVKRANKTALSTSQVVARASALLGPLRQTSREHHTEWSLEELLSLATTPQGSNEFTRLGERTRFGVFGVLGNDCLPSHRNAFRAHLAHDLHLRPTVVNGWGLLGIEGGVDIPGQLRVGSILTRDEDIAVHIESAYQRLQVHPSRLIIISHAPPARSLDQAMRFGVQHIGSESLRTFVEREQPTIVLCGHVHNAGGSVDHIGKTVVVNAASSDTDIERAHVALITLSPDREPQIQWMTKSPQRLTSLPDIGYRRSLQLEAAGFRSRDGVMAAQDSALVAAGLTASHVVKIRLQQFATEVASLVQFWPIDAPAFCTTGAVDVETGITERDPWMLGLLLPNESTVRQWTVAEPDPDARAGMYSQFLDVLDEHSVTTLVSWGGNNFDRGAITFGLSRWAPALLGRWNELAVVDLTCVLRHALALPADIGWTLDTFAPYCGADLGTGSVRMSGLEIGLAYDAYRRDRCALPLDDILNKNRIDVEALAFLLRLAQNEEFKTAQLEARPDWQGRLLPAVNLLPRKSAWQRRTCSIRRGSL